MPWAAIGAGASLLSGVGNFLAQSSANDRAAMIQDRSFQQWMSLHIPDPEQQKVALTKFVQQGELDPKLQQSIQQNPSEFQKIATNATNTAAQNRALSELQGIGTQGGLRLQDKAALQDAMMDQQVKDRANREAISADMERRGLGGSGFDVAAQLQAQQGTSDQAANNSLKVAAQAQDRALQALQGAGNLATQYRTQDFGEQAQKATAADKINAFNTQNLRDVQGANVAAANRAQELNLANKQATANQNTQLSNSEQMYNKGLAQQNYENQIKRLQGATGQADKIAQTTQTGGQILGNTISNMGGAVAGAASSMGNYDYLDNYLKKQKAAQQNPYQ